jgi:type II secretion system protein G
MNLFCNDGGGKVMHTPNFRNGFTLIELVIVIAILGILAGIAIPRYIDATDTARGSKIMADLRTIESAVMMYQAKTGSLPSKEADLYTDNAAANPPQYQLLAAWPVPPQGDAYFTKFNGKVVRFHVTATAYHLNVSTGRAYIGSYPVNTIEHILTLTPTSDTDFYTTGNG